MIGFLRVIGLLNAGIWLGAAAFFTFAINPSANSKAIHDLLGPANYPYFSGAIGQVLMTRYFRWQLACSLVALLHVLAEWLYSGKIPRRLWLGLLAGLIALNLLGGFWLEPRLQEWHTVRYAVNVTPQKREAAARSFNAWQTVSQSFNLLILAGVAIYFLRIATPPDSARFVSAVKFRS